jgi:hypothetical protein
MLFGIFRKMDNSYIWPNVERNKKKTEEQKKKYIPMTFYKAMVVPILIYGSEIFIKKREEAKIETAERTIFSSAVGCIRKGQINTKIRE